MSKALALNRKPNYCSIPSSYVGLLYRPIQRLVFSGSRVEAPPKVLNRVAPRFIHGLQNIQNMYIRRAVVQHDVLVQPRRYPR